MADSLPIVLIACRVFRDLFEHILPQNGQVRSITYLDYGLHLVPRNLQKAIQELIDGIKQPSLVVLGYGLCGNSLHGIQSGQHILLVPRTDDCIAILLGSHQDYLREFHSNPATYYLTKGWLESGSNPLVQYRDYLTKYDPETSAWLMDQQYQHYKRLALVAHSMEELQAIRPQAKEVAEYCERWGMHYEEILGSDIYIRKLVETAMTLDQAGDEFLVVPPGGILTQDHFRQDGT